MLSVKADAMVRLNGTEKELEMEIDADKMLEHAIREGMTERCKDVFKGYNSPMDKVINRAIEDNRSELVQLLSDAVKSCVGDEAFREEIKSSTRKVLAKTLVARFGGEIEKQVNALKSDPTTRARIVLAIEEIVQSK